VARNSRNPSPTFPGESKPKLCRKHQFRSSNVKGLQRYFLPIEIKNGVLPVLFGSQEGACPTKGRVVRAVQEYLWSGIESVFPRACRRDDRSKRNLSIWTTGYLVPST